MRRSMGLRAAAAVAVLAVVAAACGSSKKSDNGGSSTTAAGSSSTAAAPAGDGVFKVGYLLPKTGQLAFLGPPMIKAVEMANSEIDAAGGVNGKPMVLTGQDDGTDPDVATAGTDKLLNEKVDVIVGAAASGISLAVIDKITGTPIVQCSPSNTGLQFTTYKDNGYYFRTAPPDNLQSKVMANVVTGDNKSKVVIVARSDEYGEGFADALKKELESGGVTVADKILYDPKAGNYQAEATKIKAAAPDGVVLIAFDEGAQVIQAAIAAGIGPDKLQWYGTDGIQSSSFAEKVDPKNKAILNGMKGTAPSAAPADGETTFRDRFAKFAPGVDTIYSGHAYDCVVVAALAATEAKNDSPQAIQAHMIDVTKGGEKCKLYADCVKLLQEGKDIDYDGAAGPLDFVDAGEPGAGAYDIWHFDNAGKVVTDKASVTVSG